VGHAVMLAIEDIMTRFARMRGKSALWLPGTDHAAIATQTKVEKLLINDGMKDPRGELGREEFLKRVEAFASESHDIIVNQSKKMGASMDWSREAFTLDEARNRAVNTVFKMMYDDGLIYQGDRLVNWCPRCKSTLADDEVEYTEEKAKFYYFKYGPVVIGTARPETKFLDKIIIVHPDDDRYKALAGKEMEVEWIEGPVMAKVVADEAADKDMGSGAMTITPAHSFVDFDLARKYGFEVHHIINEDGNLTDAAGSFAGKNARDSRDEIVKRLQEKGLVDHIDEDYTHNLSVCYRCGHAVEPLPKIQWFIDVNKTFTFRASEHAPINGIKDGQEVTLKYLMQHSVRSGEVKIIPGRFEKTYFHWIDHLRDWNISRQIWYGHRVPVWTRGQETVVGQAPDGQGWQQDPDTLDTWFSAGLWTFSTLGWPDSTGDLNRFHPTSVLETGYDILFFWVARMILMTTYTLGEVPFHEVYLHGLIRDEKGRKMSKSLDNVIDPLDMIDQYGADATRLSLVVGSTPGNDAKLSEEKVASYRNFTNKLWNISRFVLSFSASTEHEVDVEPSTLADRWILSRLHNVSHQVTNHLQQHEFSQAAEILRDFTWNEFADWYLEIAKIQKRESTDHVLLYVLKHLLVYWHPFMPFVTERIWNEICPDSMLVVESWKVVSEKYSNEPAVESFNAIRELIVALRNIRSQYNIPYTTVLNLTIATEDSALVQSNLYVIESMAKVARASIVITLPTDSGITEVLSGMTVRVNADGMLDVVAHRARQETQMNELRAYIGQIDKKLSNTDFVQKAPADVVEQMRYKKKEASSKLDRIISQHDALL
jgi:valyl-tRNA synthetase